MAGITSTKKIKGQPHLLAYITPNEVKKLKALGGQETMTPEGIPAYPEWDVGKGTTKESYEAGRTGPTGGKGGSTFETYQGDKNIGTDLGLMSKYGTTKQKLEAQKALDKGKTYGYGGNQSIYEKMKTNRINRNINWATKNKEKKTKALRDYIAKTLQTNPHMDVDEIMEGLAGSFNPNTNTFGEYEFTSGLNKGTTFDLSKYGATQLGPFGLKTTGVTNKPLGTKFLDSTPDFASIGMTPVALQALGLGKPNMNTLKSHFNRVNMLDDLIAKGPNLKQADIDAYYDLTNPNRHGSGNDDDFKGYPYPYPLNYNTGAATPIDEEKTFAYRFGTGQNVGADVTQGFYAANGGRVPRNMGGIMNAVPRQGYLLGKIVKSVGKAIGSVADAAGKVLKSDLGKAAILAGGYYYGGGNLFGLQRAGASGFGTAGGFGLSGLRDKVASSDFFSKMLMNKAKTGFNPFKVATAFSPLLAFTDLAKAPVDQMPGDDGTRGGRLIDPLTGEEATPAEMRASIEAAKEKAGGDPVKLAAINQKYNNMLFTNLPYENYGLYANGGRIRAEEGGLMNLGGLEKDYRNEGGFVPIGKEEKADDVPARLSVNEFVFTADAVRNAGGGDIDKGAEVMENMMKNLENGGRISEESQGNTGAQEMFSVSERLGEVI